MNRTIYNNLIIKIVSSVCSSGKTYALNKFTLKNQHMTNTLYVLPSLELVNQVYDDLKELSIKSVKKITSETNEHKVKAKIVEHLKGCRSENEILLITWSAYDDLAYLPNKSNWKIYIDEIPQVDQFFHIDITQNKNLITSFMELDEDVNADISSLRIKSDCRFKLEKASRSSDSGYKDFKPLYRAVLSKNREVFVNKGKWIKAIKSKKDGEMFFISMLNPKQFRNCTLMGANIESSLLYLWFNKFYGISFKDNEHIINKLRFTEHSPKIGDRVKIDYFIKRNYSKYFRDKETDDEKLNEQDIYNNGHMMDKLAINHFEGQDFLYAHNRDWKKKSLLKSEDNAKNISVKSHGLNTYDNETNIYFNLALNLSPAHEKLLNQLGIGGINEDGYDRIKVAITYETIYQGLMRTNLRDPDSVEKVNVLVPDKKTAEYLARLLGGGSIQGIGGINEPVKLRKFSNGERKNRKLFKDEMDDLLNHIPMDGKLPVGKTDEYLSLDEMNNEQVAFTEHKKEDDYKPEQFRHTILGTKKFVNFLKKASKVVYKEKDEVQRINSTIFDPTIDTGGYRRQNNFIKSYFMILDFDNGELSPEKFEKTFKEHSFVICNTFSRSAEQPNRFRVFMFYKEPVKSIKQHKLVFLDIEKILNNHGYDPDISGLDKGCSSGNQSFQLPCTNMANIKHHFFRKHNMTRIANVKEKSIAVDLIAKTSSISHYDLSNVTAIRDDVDIDQIIGEMITRIQSMDCDRHDSFFDCAVDMRTLGIPLNEIENYCYQIAGDDPKMKLKVKGIMSSLVKYQH